jgi:hypothetical protein
MRGLSEAHQFGYRTTINGDESDEKHDPDKATDLASLEVDDFTHAVEQSQLSC